jgi:hypothetical protein
MNFTQTSRCTSHKISLPFLELLNEEVIVILMTQFIVFFNLCTLEVCSLLY